MRNLKELDHLRDIELELRLFGVLGDSTCGVFTVPYGGAIQFKNLLRVLASSGGGWDHLSISLQDRTPRWEEMEAIRRMFFLPTETVLQIHAPVDKYVDGTKHGCVNCLHLWRNHKQEIELPPQWMIGGMTQEECDKQAAAAGVI